jgi:hypothetical protein
MNMQKPKVLVIHALRPTSRQTTIDHLLSFREHLPNADVQYLHFQQPLPRDIGEVSPDLLIVNYDYLNYRFSPLWPFIKNRHKDIAQRAGKVVAIAQDDFWANKLLDNWCMDWEIDRILTASEGGWELLYPRSHKKIEICESLTGYSKSTVAPKTLALKYRRIDLGQRVRTMPAHLGRIGQLKANQATSFAAIASDAGFNVDVSTRVEDSFIGAAWFDFLASCRFTIGMKGGASLIDPYGLIHTKVDSFTKLHPSKTYEQIESACFKGKDTNNEFVAISPRLFESASAGTCQILPPANYLDVLEPWEHYLPLNLDLSNSIEVLSAMRDLERCQEIAVRAREVLVESGDFDYSKLVNSATTGLLTANNHLNRNWNLFCDFLNNSRALQMVSLELHDAAQILIMDVVTHNEKDRKKHGISSEIIRQKLADCGKTEWFNEQVKFSLNDKCFKRSVWTWRDPMRVVE